MSYRIIEKSRKNRTENRYAGFWGFDRGGLSDVWQCIKAIPNADIDQLDGLWDSCIMLFVGVATKNISAYLKLCRDRLLVIDRGGCRESLTAGEKERAYHSLLPMINDFLGSGIRCSLTDHTLEYGQPLKDLEEAYAYVSFYHKNPCNQSIPEFIHENLIRTDDREYPYYLPYKKTFGVVEIRKADNLHLL